MKEFILAILPIIMVVSCEKEPEKIKCIEFLLMILPDVFENRKQVFDKDSR